MTEKCIAAFLMLIYAVGCAASVVEIHAQRNEPMASKLRKHPLLNVLMITFMIAVWPLMVTWYKVREAWR